MRIRSLPYLFFLFLFVLCAWFGFGVTRQVNQSLQANVVQAAPPGQFNFLLVGLDGQKGGPPHLASAWLALVKRGETSSIIFKLIYPNPGNAADWQDVQHGFAAMEGTQLPAAFQQKITSLRLPISATLLLDRGSLPALSSSLGASLPTSQSLTGSKQPAGFSETAQINALCRYLSGAVHLKSEPLAQGSPTTSWMDPWKGLVTSLRFASCEVLVGP